MTGLLFFVEMPFSSFHGISFKHLHYFASILVFRAGREIFYTNKLFW